MLRRTVAVASLVQRREAGSDEMRNGAANQATARQRLHRHVCAASSAQRPVKIYGVATVSNTSAAVLAVAKPAESVRYKTPSGNSHPATYTDLQGT
jgi:hypothetical protein